MKWRWRVLRIVLTSVVVLTAAVLIWPRESEPVYEGRTLSQWLAFDKESPDVRLAILHMGTNALPSFVRWISYEPSRSKKRSLFLATKVPSWLGGERIYDIIEGGWESRASGAELGLELLGPVAAPAAPELTALMRHTNRDVRLRAIEGLAHIGESASPPLAAALNDQQYPDRGDVAGRLFEVYRDTADTNTLMAVTRRCLHDSDPQVVLQAVRVVRSRAFFRGRYYWDFTIPALTDLVGHSDPRVRYYAVEALGSYGAEARPALHTLVGALQDADFSVRLAATNAFERVVSAALDERFGNSQAPGRRPTR